MAIEHISPRKLLVTLLSTCIKPHPNLSNFDNFLDVQRVLFAFCMYSFTGVFVFLCAAMYPLNSCLTAWFTD